LEPFVHVGVEVDLSEQRVELRDVLGRRRESPQDVPASFVDDAELLVVAQVGVERASLVDR
jgi:hypothetical protein